MFRNRLFIGYLIVTVIITLTPAWAYVKLGPDSFEMDGEVLGDAVSEGDLDNSRGAYLGINFSVLFEGFWDTLGNYNANLIATSNAGAGNTTGSTGVASNIPPNTAVKIEASVGGFGPAKGIFQVTQVPGSGNVVSNTMIINIQIIQVLGNTVQNILTKF